MAKISKASIKDRMAEYAVTVAKIDGIEKKQNAEVDPFLAQYEKDTAPILAKHERKLTPLIEKRDELAADIYEFLNAQEKDIEIEMSGYVAERKTQTKLMPRVIDVKKFMEKAKVKGEAMYACVSIFVKKAEDLLGKEIDQISTRPEKVDVVTQLRLK